MHLLRSTSSAHRRLCSPWVSLCALLALSMLGACADTSEKAFPRVPPGANNNVNNTNNPNNPPFVPEVEKDYAFSLPAIYDQQVYVANETLNTVAVIDSESLAIRTIPVGFRPTKVVGPSIPDAVGASIIALNQGSASVSVINPVSGQVDEVRVMPGANALVASPGGEYAVAWYDRGAAKAGERAGDLSSVSVIKGGKAYAVAVGFGVRRVSFSEDGQRALVLSDDGLSTIDLAALDGDQFSPPLSTLPPSLISLSPTDLEVLIDRQGRYVVTRSTSFKGLVLLDVAQRQYHLLYLPETPTDIDLVQGQQLELLVMLRAQEQLVRATIPEGFVNAAAATAPPALMALNATDMGLDMASGDMAGLSDMGDMAAPADMPDQAPDMMPAPDMGVMGPTWPVSADGLTLLSFPERGFGAASVTGDGTQALLYTTIGNERRVVLYHLLPGTTEELFVEKRVRGVTPDAQGRTFVLFHDKEELEPDQAQPQSPADPGFVANSWGVSIVNIMASTARLVLTEHEPAQAALWNHPDTDPLVYIIFEPPTVNAALEASHRDVLMMNLSSFRIESFRVPSLPEGLGIIPDALRIFVNQRHPQGRMSFVDVKTQKRQTITGYQLNAGID